MSDTKQLTPIPPTKGSVPREGQRPIVADYYKDYAHPHAAVDVTSKNTVQHSQPRFGSGTSHQTGASFEHKECCGKSWASDEAYKAHFADCHTPRGAHYAAPHNYNADPKPTAKSATATGKPAASLG